MAIISLQNITMAFNGPPVLDSVSLQIEKNQRICLLGRNGTGKSTLMKILAGEITPDAGEIVKDQSFKVSYFSQNIPEHLPGTVFEIIANGLGKSGQLLISYHDALHSGQTDRELVSLMEEIDRNHAWSAQEDINRMTSLMGLDNDWVYTDLSGGQKRRVVLASVLAGRPDLLLLDEPTNHLDIDSILWLEEYLLKSSSTLLFVTHDRALLKKLATRIIELDRGRLVDWSCNYETFLERKDSVIKTQEKEWKRFDLKLAQEEVWIRKGICARRTRNEGRVRALKALREERKKRREMDGTVRMKIDDSIKSGKLVIRTEGVSFGFTETPIIRDLDLTICRGDKIGIIGPNGCGKSTLMKLLCGSLAPDSGTIRHGTNLELNYFDQLREQLDGNLTVMENVTPNSDTVTINGKSKHIISYLQDFLFTPDEAKSYASTLSGGERNRLMLARMFTRPANLLALDEPTNDLDAETLELLEELLIDYQGTLLLICHDRSFINNVVTSTLSFNRDGTVKEIVGGYDEWHDFIQQQKVPVQNAGKVDRKTPVQSSTRTAPKKKLTFKEQRELEALPEEIERLESTREDLFEKLARPDSYQDAEFVKSSKSLLDETEDRLQKAYQRWEELESIASQAD